MFFFNKITDMILWCGMLVMCCFFSKISMKRLIRSGRAVLFLIIVTAILNLIWTPGKVLASIGPIKITDEGIKMAVLMALRLYLLVLFGSLLMMTTSPLSFSDALERLFAPLKIVRFPASETAMMMTIALRFIPTLFEEFDRIVKAQLSRGADLGRGGLIRRAKSYVPILVPLFVLVFQRADRLASAMESRSYTPGALRSRLRPIKWRMIDTAAAFFVFAAIVGIWAFDRYLAW